MDRCIRCLLGASCCRVNYNGYYKCICDSLKNGTVKGPQRAKRGAVEFVATDIVWVFFSLTLVLFFIFCSFYFLFLISFRPFFHECFRTCKSHTIQLHHQSPHTRCENRWRKVRLKNESTWILELILWMCSERSFLFAFYISQLPVVLPQRLLDINVSNRLYLEKRHLCFTFVFVFFLLLFSPASELFIFQMLWIYLNVSVCITVMMHMYKCTVFHIFLFFYFASQCVSIFIYCSHLIRWRVVASVRTLNLFINLYVLSSKTVTKQIKKYGTSKSRTNPSHKQKQKHFFSETVSGISREKKIFLNILKSAQQYFRKWNFYVSGTEAHFLRCESLPNKWRMNQMKLLKMIKKNWFKFLLIPSFQRSHLMVLSAFRCFFGESNKLK